jgi:hypothetical protein
MPPDAIAADNAPLTIEQAVAHLDAAEIEREDEAPAVAEQPEKQNTEAEPAAEDASEPETAIDGDDADTEESEAEGDEPQLPALSPPALWNAEDKEAFSELPRHLQERLLAKETESNRAVSAKMEEAATIRKAAEAEVSRIGEFTARLDKLIPEAEQTFASNWGTAEIDWNKVASEHGVERAFQLKNDHDTQLRSIQQLRAAKDTADSVATARFLEVRNEEMKTVVPDLVDTKEGPQRQLELVKYLAAEGGVDPQVILRQATAKELAIGYKAYLFDKLQADAKAKASAPPTQARTTTVPKPSVRPTATPARNGSPQQARINSLSRKSSLTMDEAVELLDLQES